MVVKVVDTQTLWLAVVAFALLAFGSTTLILLKAPSFTGTAHEPFQPLILPPSLRKPNENIQPSEVAIRYWEKEIELDGYEKYKRDTRKIGRSHEGKLYVLFEDDTGGWNNIRMAFECFTVVAWLTGRTLVIPPRSKFYLLDRGPIKLFEKPSARTSSTYSDFYNFEILSREIDIITTDEFLDLEHDMMYSRMPENVKLEISKKIIAGNGDHTDYFLWLREFHETTIWPSGPRINEEFNPFDLHKIQNLKLDKKILYFPMHVHKNLRYLSGVPNLINSRGMIKNEDMLLKQVVKKFVREHLIYADHIINKAVEVVEKLGGMGTFASAHIRRNELQYKTVFLSASSSLANMQPSLLNEELIYLATDETESGFFEVFEKQGYKLIRLQDIKQQHPELFEDFLPKYDGMLEQIICASGRIFFATPFSTFSSYILRLRGYMYGESEASGCLFHTERAAVGKTNCANGFTEDALLWKME